MIETDILWATNTIVGIGLIIWGLVKNEPILLWTGVGLTTASAIRWTVRIIF